MHTPGQLTVNELFYFDEGETEGGRREERWREREGEVAVEEGEEEKSLLSDPGEK